VRISRARYRRLGKANKKASMDFAPFCDFLFSLIFVFMVASPINLGGVKIDLPKGKAEIVVVKKEPLAVTIKKDGSIFLEKNQIRLSVLGSKLNEITGGEKDVKIFVLADKDINYGRVLAIVSAVYEEGFFDVTLVTELQRI
jgi:biopolymer transport protein ExbD